LLVLLVLVVSSVVAGTIELLSGEILKFDNEKEFINILLKTFTPEASDSSFIVYTDDTLNRDEVRFILTSPEKFELEEDSPISFYSSLDSLYASREYKKTVDNYGRRNVFAIEIDVKVKDMVALHSQLHGKVVDARGPGKYRGLKQGW